jgi:murein L,D-transpeptidase YafK
MTRHTWYTEDGERPSAESGLTETQSLWTRRSALALTAGLVGIGALSGPATAMTQKLHPRANHIVVSKKNRVLALMSGQETLRRYRVNLGFTPEGHKLQSGDGRTPEGRYYINRRNPRSDYHLSLGISYPNPIDLARAMAMGVDPGGDIFIHGGPVRSTDRRSRDWTAGCIAVSDREVEEIWSLVPTGTPITILA